MIKDHSTIMYELREYANPKARLTRMIDSGKVVRIRRGLYLDADDRTYSLKSLAGIIYGPSYISFEYALSHYGLIPERATAITSAVYHKNKNRQFHTPVGDFYYYYLPSEVYPYGVLQEQENDQPYLIASREKALCDMLYKARKIATRDELRALLFDDWRMEREDVLSMDAEALNFLAPLYRRRIFSYFLDWFNTEAVHA